MNIFLPRNNCHSANVFCGVLSVAVLVMLFIPFSAQAGPILTVDETAYSAGEVYSGEVVEHRFLISNTGDAPLEVQRVRSS